MEDNLRDRLVEKKISLDDALLKEPVDEREKSNCKEMAYSDGYMYTGFRNMQSHIYVTHLETESLVKVLDTKMPDAHILQSIKVKEGILGVQTGRKMPESNEESDDEVKLPYSKTSQRYSLYDTKDLSLKLELWGDINDYNPYNSFDFSVKYDMIAVVDKMVPKSASNSCSHHKINIYRISNRKCIFTCDDEKEDSDDDEDDDSYEDCSDDDDIDDDIDDDQNNNDIKKKNKERIHSDDLQLAFDPSGSDNYFFLVWNLDFDLFVMKVSMETFTIAGQEFIDPGVDECNAWAEQLRFFAPDHNVWKINGNKIHFITKFSDEDYNQDDLDDTPPDLDDSIDDEEEIRLEIHGYSILLDFEHYTACTLQTSRPFVYTTYTNTFGKDMMCMPEILGFGEKFMMFRIISAPQSEELYGQADTYKVIKFERFGKRKKPSRGPPPGLVKSAKQISSFHLSRGQASPGQEQDHFGPPECLGDAAWMDGLEGDLGPCLIRLLDKNSCINFQVFYWKHDK